MESICGVNCSECEFNKTCKGCKDSNGCPFGKKCFIANYIEIGGKDKFEELKKELISEINSLGFFKVDNLFALNGSFVNMEYVLPNNDTVKFLDDSEVYLGNQIEIDNDLNLCYGVVCNMNFILICTYGENGSNPELVLYKKR